MRSWERLFAVPGGPSGIDDLEAARLTGWFEAEHRERVDAIGQAAREGLTASLTVNRNPPASFRKPR